METRVLRYFLTIARLGTVSAAARELHIAQPTLSRQIQQLEQQLGVELFKRERRRMILTKAGTVYQERIKNILAELSSANEAVAEINNQSLMGTVNIGCVQSSIHQFVIPQLAHFYHRYPGVNLHLYDADGEDIKERLDQGELDCGIVSTPISTVKYHAVRLPINDQWGIAVGQNNQLYGRSQVSIKDLTSIPLFIPHRSLIKSEIDAWLGSVKSQLHIVGESNLIANQAYLTQAIGAGLICIKGAPLPADCQLSFIPITPQRIQKHYLIWRKGVSLGNAASRLVTWLIDQAQSE